MRRLALALALTLACAHSPPPPPGPQPLAGDGALMKDRASVAIRLRHEVLADRVVALHIDLSASGEGSVGPITWTATADGFLLEGASAWNGELATGQQTTQVLRLRPTAEGVARVTITYGTADVPDAGAITVPFLVSADAIRPCTAADEVCKPAS